MSKLTDPQLLRDYAGTHSESAFTELVTRHIDLVYSAALRMVRDSHLANDVAQGTFMALAQNAPRLVDHPVLSGWLHRTALNIAAQTVRTAARRRVREQEAVAMNELLSTESDSTWELIAPHLDVAMGELSEPDRDALMLRYFERKSAREMAAILRITEEAAQKRVNRAVERLREFLEKRGVSIGAGGLTLVISANAVHAAPVGLAATISAAVFVGATVSSSTAIAAAKIIAMSTIQKTVLTAALVILAGAGIYQARQAASLREQIHVLQQEKAAMASQFQQLQSERDDATNRLALLAQNASLKPDSNLAELLKLRGEVGRLRQQAQKSPLSRVDLLKQKLAEMPEKGIPELKLLKYQDWLKAAGHADLTTDDGVRIALCEARNKAVDVFFNLARTAIKDYLAANNNILPSDLLPLKPYFEVPVTDDMLQRYAFLQSGVLSTNMSEPLVAEVGADVDEIYDSKSQMSMSGASGSIWNNVQGAVSQAAMEYTLDNNGQLPTDSSQIAPYLHSPIDNATLQKYFAEVTANLTANPPPAEVVTLIPAIKAFNAANNGHFPQNSSDLAPYLTTPEQQAALQKLEASGSTPR